MPLSKYVHKVVYLPYNQFWRSKILPIVHVSIFLNTAGPQNARNALSEYLILPTPPPSKKQVQSFWSVFSLERTLTEKKLATGLAEDNSWE